MFKLGIADYGLLILIIGALQWLIQLWISERLKASIQKENGKYMEELKWQFKVKEYVIKIAEYIPFALFLKEDSSDADYIKANQLSMELAMTLPEELYRAVAKAIKPNNVDSVKDFILESRKIILKKEAGNLSMDDILVHHSGIGRKR